jgi:dipeptidyl aminopeptidase/acylaminoacyl peptidase
LHLVGSRRKENRDLADRIAPGRRARVAAQTSTRASLQAVSGAIPAASAGARYLRMVLRSTPRLAVTDVAAQPLLPMSAEFADPPWELDYSTYAVLPDGRIVCRYRQAGTDQLALFDPHSGRLERLPVPYTSIKPYLRATDEHLVFIGGGPTTLPAVVSLDLASGAPTVLAAPGDAAAVAARFLSMPQRIEFPTNDGQTAEGLYYPPTNQEAMGPAGQRPPLLVQPHPGPTAEATSRLDLRTQFFTSRGFAVVNVNYAGSSGHGRAYRERLTGQWGILDVADCINAAHHLTAAGKADPDRLLIAAPASTCRRVINNRILEDEFFDPNSRIC